MGSIKAQYWQNPDMTVQSCADTVIYRNYIRNNPFVCGLFDVFTGEIFVKMSIKYRNYIRNNPCL